MQRIRFSLQLESSISCHLEQAYYQEQFIIPGSTIRGAIANLYLMARGKDEKFDSIFNRSSNRFPFLFAAYKDELMIKAPRTTGACKRHLKNHPLVPRVRDLCENMDKEKVVECICKQPVKPYTDYIGKGKPSLEKSYVGHTAIHEKTNTALPHAYFRELLISPIGKEVHFCGYGYLDNESYEIIRELCENEIMIGKSKSRGRGWGKLILEEAPFQLNLYPEEKIQKALQSESKDIFSVHCVTPCIFLDSFLRPTPIPPIEWKGNISLASKKEDSFDVSMKAIEGWSVVHSLPKVKDMAVDIGSVYLFKKNEALKNEDEFQKFVETKEKEGLGERKIEGYGEIRINDKSVFAPEEVQ